MAKHGKKTKTHLDNLREAQEGGQDPVPEGGQDPAPEAQEGGQDPAPEAPASGDAADASDVQNMNGMRRIQASPRYAPLSRISLAHSQK